jgi:hypothetical protein
MATVRVNAPVKSAELSGVVVRCGCAPEQKVSVNWHGYHNQVCPNPRAIENRGRLAYYHRNPLKRWLVNLAMSLRDLAR